MGVYNIEYKMKTANENQIYTHLIECDNSFSPPLSQRVNIHEYAKKLAEKSITFEAWNSDNLIGLVAAYLNDKINASSLITNVSTVKSHINMGIATELISMLIDYIKGLNRKQIELEVNKNNQQAIRFYEKLNFIKIDAVGDNIKMQLTI